MLAFLAYLTAEALERLLPARAVRVLARALARLAFALRVPARAALEANLALALPGAGPAQRRDHARAAFETFALSLVEFLHLSRLTPECLERAIEVRGGEHLARARSGGRGVIVLSAHLANWEWGAAYLATLGGAVHVVARPHRSAWVEGWFARRRARAGVRSLGPAPVWPRAARALRADGWVAVMADRPARGSRGTGCAWAAALARRTGAVILPAVMVRLGPGRFAACFERPLSPAECARGGVRDTLGPYVARHAAQWCAFELAPDGIA